MRRGVFFFQVNLNERSNLTVDKQLLASSIKSNIDAIFVFFMVVFKPEAEYIEFIEGWAKLSFVCQYSLTTQLLLEKINKYLGEKVF